MRKLLEKCRVLPTILSSGTAIFSLESERSKRTVRDFQDVPLQEQICISRESDKISRRETQKIRSIAINRGVAIKLAIMFPTESSLRIRER